MHPPVLARLSACGSFFHLDFSFVVSTSFCSKEFSLPLILTFWSKVFAYDAPHCYVIQFSKREISANINKSQVYNTLSRIASSMELIIIPTCTYSTVLDKLSSQYITYKGTLGFLARTLPPLSHLPHVFKEVSFAIFFSKVSVTCTPYLYKCIYLHVSSSLFIAPLRSDATQ
jgi:hypothetical protein